MKTITTEFKELCISKLGQNNGERVYFFYMKLSKKSYSTEKGLNLTTRRSKSLNYLLDNYGEEALLKTIDIFEKKIESGSATVLTIPYFNKCVENYKPEISVQSNPLFNSQGSQEQIYPIKLKQLYDNPIEALKWLYKCSGCNTEFDGFNETCPSCKKLINWKLVINNV